MINKILTKHDIPHTVELLPWKRCLSEVKIGKNYSMLLSASYSEERNSDYLMSQPYYQMQYGFFYLKEKHPFGLNIRTVFDLNKFKICGLRGYNYEHLGVSNELIDSNIKSYDNLIKIMKTQRQRCDIFLEGREILSGFKVLGKDYLGNEIVFEKIPWIKPKNFHMMFPKSQSGQKLLILINKELNELKENGEYAKIYSKYFD